jgi:hypothetical protein
MLIRKNKVTEVTIGKNEAGMFEYKDSGKAIEMGEKAFTIERENIMTEEIETLYYEKRENAELGKDLVKVF